jgi:lysophospholipase L1-like esterase
VRIQLIVGALLVLFVALKVGARYILTTTDDPEQFLTYASAKQLRDQPEFAARYLRFRAHRYLGYQPTPGFQRGDLTHNALGYKDDEIVLPKPEGEFRIVCPRGSTTYTPTTGATALSYPNLLEQRLHDEGFGFVNVINGGVDGWTSYELVIHFSLRVAELDPDLIIIHGGLNDTYARIVWPPEAFQGDNSGFRAPLHDNVVMPSLWEHSSFLRVMGIKLGLAQSHFELRTLFDMQQGDTFYADDLERQLAENRYPDGIFREIDVAGMLAANGDQYFMRNLEHLIVLARHHGAQTIVSTIPYGTARADGKPARGLVRSEPFLAALRESNKHMGDLAKKMGVGWLDLAAAFPDDPSFFADGIHVTLEGAQEKARRFAAFLVEEGYVAQGP